MKTFIKPLLAAIAVLLSTLGAQAQVKIGSNPTTIESTSNLEVEASTPNRQIKVDKTTGQLTIKDGTEGTSKILTSDANGGASWQTLKNTTVASFSQTSPGATVNIISTSTPICGLAVGNIVPSCAIDLNRNANFTVTNPLNDVIIDVTGNYSVAFNTSQTSFNIVIAVDKTSPGVYEVVDNLFITHTGVSCSADYINFKTTLKNLSARSYNVKIYLAPWLNPGAAAVVGVGRQSNTGACGNNDFANQKVVITLSQ